MVIPNLDPLVQLWSIRCKCCYFSRADITLSHESTPCALIAMNSIGCTHKMWSLCLVLFAVCLAVNPTQSSLSSRAELVQLDLIHRAEAGDPSLVLPIDGQCLAIPSITDPKHPVIDSLKLLDPQPDKMSTLKFQARMIATVKNFTEVTSRNEEFSLCYQLFALESSHGHRRDKALFETCGLQVFDSSVLTAQPGNLRLVMTLFHTPPPLLTSTAALPLRPQPTPRIVCRSETRFSCCLNVSAAAEDWVSDEDFERAAVQQYVTIARQLPHSTAAPRPLRSPLFPLNDNDNDKDNSKDQVKVLIGIKSFALNIDTRNAIRQTWFQFLRDERPASLRTRTVDFFPFFLIGESDIAHDWRAFTVDGTSLQSAMDDERSAFQDMLGDLELEGAKDSYFNLPQKVLKFLKWSQIDRPHPQSPQFPLAAPTTTTESATRKTTNSTEFTSETIANATEFGGYDPYVIICDDDTYLNLQELRLLVEFYESQKQGQGQGQGQGQKRFGGAAVYSGEVLEARLHHKFKPVHDTAHPHYLPPSAFPFSELPPFALGNFYLLSALPARYLARNADWLQPVGSLEDLSVGFWLLSMQVC
jgi:hypothetical protein